MNAFNNLPVWARVILIFLGVLLIVGVGILIPVLSTRVLMVMGGGIVAVALLLLAYGGLLKLLEKRKSGFMVSALGKHNSGSGSISDAAQRAKLDDLRQTFEEGVRKFKNAGKDLYSLPWYPVIGEPGSGKTEAIRHSNVGFPPGLQDELQGTGGTINMNWWFTNQAVFLDTAGRLIFEDVDPGSTNEWKEFLRLLKKARPHCPINGMILCIPSDTLIKDSQAELDAKARKLASQLNDIQRALDVRFPVFVLVTKSDLVPGFREFFEDIRDPQMQHQMVGWSNPRPLDEAFHPDELDVLLDDYLSELYRRRLALLEDPNPVRIGGRRLDEVDSLFTYPSNLKALFPRLKRYLETIFAAGEWAQKPLFLRGIYFTSSLQEGSALDEELANALDLPLDELPEGKVWEKEKAYFLRDVCKEKVFKESRLVTRATNAKKQLRQRQMVLFWTGVACLVGLAAFAYYGANSLKKSVGGQLEYWTFLEEEMKQEDSFVPSAVYEGREKGTFVNNTSGSIELESGLTTVEEFHTRLRELAEEEVEVPEVFKILFLGSVNRESRLQAQRVAFEHYVIRPLLKHSRLKLSSLPVSEWDESATNALKALLILERERVNHEKGISRDPLEPVNLINPLMVFLTGEPAGPGLPGLLEKTYFSADLRDPGAIWPPEWASGGDTIHESPAIANGIRTYLAWIGDLESKRVDALKRVGNAYVILEDLAGAENILLEQLGRLQDPRDLNDITRAYDWYLEKLNDAEREIRALAEIFATEQRAVLTLHDSFRDGVGATLENFESAIGFISEIYSGLNQHSDVRLSVMREGDLPPLFQEVNKILEREREQYTEMVTGLLSEEQLEWLRKFDSRYLAPQGFENRFSYRVRAVTYRRILETFSRNFEVPEAVAGRMQESLEPLMSTLEDILYDIDNYDGGLTREFQRGARNALSYFSSEKFGQYARSHRQVVLSGMRGALGFPLVMESEIGTLGVEEIRGIRERINALRRDLNSRAFTFLTPQDREQLKEISTRFDSIESMTLVYVTESGEPRNARFSFASEPYQREYLKTFYPDEPFNGIFGGRSFRDFAFRGRERIRAYQASEVELAALPLNAGEVVLEFFQLADSEEPDAVLRTDRPWAPLEFVLNNRSIRAEPKVGEHFEPGQVWHVLVELPATGEKPLVVVLTVQFSHPIPERKDWPRLAELNLKDPDPGLQ